MTTRTRTLCLLAAAALLPPSAGAAAQDLNIALPVDSLEYLMRTDPFEMPDELPGLRGAEDRIKNPELTFSDGTTFMVKWVAASAGGEDFNNVPAHELAAYEFQRLFLEEHERVVPPTALRAVPLEWYRTLDTEVDPTFRGTRSVVVVLQYFLTFITDEDVWNENRFETDPAYARHWANLNLFTYLIRHSDSNTGNVLISEIGEPRIFAVDNGVAFNSQDSNRGTLWRTLHVTRFSASTVERLRGITEEQLHETLGVVAQWEIRNEELVSVPRTENVNPRQGVRRRDDSVQIGLTRDDIDDVWYRLEVFLGRIDNGQYQTF
jgi:hypothetical protein